MKNCLLLLIALASFRQAAGQVQDDFSDGDFTTNPAWSGDASKFEVNASKQLHLNAPAITDTAYLSTPNGEINNIEWDFFFTLDFAPSGSNFLKAYLVSDQQNLKLPLNGYFLKIGENGSDDAIALYLQQGTTETLIVQGIPGHVAQITNSVSVKVTRDGSGNWAIYSDTTGGTNFSPEATATDNTLTATAFFGFCCIYTSTRSTLFYFDNVLAGVPVADTIAPQLIQVNVISQNQLDVYFNEAVDPVTSQNVLNYSVSNGIGNPVTAIQDTTDPALVHLTFTNNFQTGVSTTITASNIMDLAGNILASASLSFTFYQAQTGDIIINEMMPDPSPAIGLPEAEYAELFNRSGSAVDLTGWTFSDGSSTAILPAYTLSADSFLILCSSSNASLFSSYGTVLGLSSFPSLNNDGDNLTLKNSLGMVISEVAYDLSWYHDDVKSEGGWSLERMDANNSCEGGANWHASADASGGTPGKMNSDLSAFADTFPPVLLSATIRDSLTIVLLFDEAVDSSGAANISNYNIEPSFIEIISAMPDSDFSEVILSLSIPLDSNTIYTLTVSGLKDCIGNTLLTIDSSQLAIPSRIEFSDIVINEILFNPETGGYDYLEIYNHTQKIFDLKELQVSRADVYDSLETIYIISPESYLFFPDQYIVISANPEWVTQNYFVQHPEWLIAATLPSFNDDEGTVILLNSINQRIDELHYYDDWHFPLITNTEGVALERIDPNRPTQDSLNWHSAASTAGYGTPTYKNSQFSQPNTGNEITLDPQVFSPDQDGYHDFLNISFQFDQPGYTANVKIFDAGGREIRNLIHNALLAQQGAFTWDGISDNGERVRVGTYIVYTEVFALNGKVRHFKNVCVVATRKS
ncbi:MAG: lamin tail domain-containing protein [Chitinophagales bacterium]